MPGLQELGLPVPVAEAQHVSRLAPLGALTYLELNMWNGVANLGGLTSLTGLKSLRADLSNYNGVEEFHPVFASMSALTALTLLTSLDINEDASFEKLDGSFQSEVSVLSCLRALRRLQCSFVGKAEVLTGDPLPVQFRFLRSATALESMHIGFCASFWSLPNASSLAMREALSALTSLRNVSIRIKGGWLEHTAQYYVPISVFAAAASIKSFSFFDGGTRLGPLSGYCAIQALDCLQTCNHSP